MQREPACISTWLLCKEAKIGQDPLHPSESSGEFAFPFFSKNRNSHVIFSADGSGTDGKLLSCHTLPHPVHAKIVQMQRGPACITTQKSSGATPSETKVQRKLSHKPLTGRTTEERGSVCIGVCMQVTLPYLPFPCLPSPSHLPPLPHARLHAGSSSRRVMPCMCRTPQKNEES
jgi:hypothetical protein